MELMLLIIIPTRSPSMSALKVIRKKVIKIVADLFAGFKEKKDIAKEPEKEQTEEKA